MRKQRQTRTGTRKLKGLSRQEASKRSKKGWQTRKLRGLWDGIYGQPSRGRVQLPDDSGRLRGDYSDLDLSDVEPHEGETQHRPRRRPTRDLRDETLEQSDLRGKTRQEQRAWDAKHMLDENLTKDELEHIAASYDDPVERDAFLAKVRQIQKTELRNSRIGTDLEDPMIATKGVEQIAKPEATVVQARSRLHGLINKDPNTRGRLVEQEIDPDFSDTWKRRAEKGSIVYKLPESAPSLGGPGLPTHRLFGKIEHVEEEEPVPTLFRTKPGKTSRIKRYKGGEVLEEAKLPLARAKDITEDELRARITKELSDRFDYFDPVSLTPSSLVRAEQRAGFQHFVMESHFGKTPGQRMFAQKKAENLANQMAAQAARREAARAEDTAKVNALDKLLPTRTKDLANILSSYEEGLISKDQYEKAKGHLDRELGQFRDDQSKVPYPTAHATDGGTLLSQSGEVSRRAQGMERRRVDIQNRLRVLKKTKSTGRINRKEIQKLQQEHLALSNRLNEYHSAHRALRFAAVRREEERYDSKKDAFKAGAQQIPHEKRLGGGEATTAEDLYQHYNPDAHVKNAYYFHRDQLQGKKRALKDGTFTAGWAEGKRVKPEDASFRVGPNIKYKYVLHDAENVTSKEKHPKKIQKLDYWDTKTIHKYGKRDSFGRLKRGQRDEVIKETEIPRYDYTFNAAVGERVRKGDTPKLRAYESKEVIIPLAGVKETSRRHQSKDLKDKGKFDILQVQDTSGHWFDASRLEYNQAGMNKATPAQKAANIHVPAARRRVIRSDKHVKITFIDPNDLQRHRKARDDIGVLYKGRAFEADLGRLGNGKAGDKMYQFSAARAERQLREKSAKAADKRLIDAENALTNREKAHYERFNPNQTQMEFGGAGPDQMQFGGMSHRHPDQDKFDQERSRLREFIGAGSAATWYASRKRVRTKSFPTAAKRAYEKSPKFRNFMKRHYRDPDDLFKDVDSAFVKPAIHHAANTWWTIKHPTMSPSGEFLGVDWGTMYRREKNYKWLPTLDPDEIAARQVRKRHGDMEQIANIDSFMQKNTYRSGKSPAAWIARHKAEGLQRYKPYREFYEFSDVTMHGGRLDEYIREARQTRNMSRPGSREYEAAYKMEMRGHELRAKHLASKKLSKAQERLVHENISTDPKKYVKGSPNLVKYVGPPARDFHLSSNQKTAAIAIGIAGTAIGSHYLYHKYKERKKAPEERVAYYNKVLPGPIELPTPHVHVSSRYRLPHNNFTDEFALGGKHVPLQLGFGAKRKAIWKGSPEDRGYTKNAKLIGGIRGGARGIGRGSIAQSAVFDLQATGERRGSWQPKYGQVAVRGRKLPIKAEIGARKKIELKSTNPNRLDQRGREDLVWAFKGTEHEREVRDWFNQGKPDRMDDMFDDKDLVKKVRKRKGESEYKAQTSETVRFSKTAVSYLHEAKSLDPVRESRRSVWYEDDESGDTSLPGFQPRPKGKVRKTGEKKYRAGAKGGRKSEYRYSPEFFAGMSGSARPG